MNEDLLAALRTLVAENLGDWIYDVRESAAGSGDGFEGSSWDHPRVKAFSDAVALIERIVKEYAK